MTTPRIAIVSFPGNNCEVESLRAISQSGMEALFFRWNDDRAKLKDVDGYFIPGGFSYEDRGRSGMVAARDPLMEFIGQEADAGKVVIGNCNGAQILIESGLVPLGKHLDMCLAHNIIDRKRIGFISSWVWITPSCSQERCATSHWSGVMHVPIAHGEGRFTTRDPDLLEELKRNDQIAFRYCDANGSVSEDLHCTPNGALYAIAGLCNPAGNVVALMPHPERTPIGLPYFQSLKRWIESRSHPAISQKPLRAAGAALPLNDAAPAEIELFIDTVITNNEERTVEAAAREVEPSIRIKQLRYIPLKGDPAAYLRHVASFNPNKEIAYVRRRGMLTRWNPDAKREEPSLSTLLSGLALVRRDEPFEGEEDPGTCYVLSGIDATRPLSPTLLGVLCNPHASTLVRIVA
ncbi:phosphoribosylformylglycinamidine synthase I [Candidatus Peribacteria bacterium]|nr:phosphoribosylformylglycinamidine synthase I [Candidatus Peribacteria bacterium]